MVFCFVRPFNVASIAMRNDTRASLALTIDAKKKLQKNFRFSAILRFFSVFIGRGLRSMGYMRFGGRVFRHRLVMLCQEKLGRTPSTRRAENGTL
jgi:hypothetical protein